MRLITGFVMTTVSLISGFSTCFCYKIYIQTHTQTVSVCVCDGQDDIMETRVKGELSVMIMRKRIFLSWPTHQRKCLLPSYRIKTVFFLTLDIFGILTFLVSGLTSFCGSIVCSGLF